MAGINTQVVCTIGSGVVGRRIGGAEGEGIGGGLISQRGAWRIGGFTGGALDGETAGGALGLQLLAITVSSLSSLSRRM
jgi:hypothetical protein